MPSTVNPQCITYIGVVCKIVHHVEHSVGSAAGSVADSATNSALNDLGETFTHLFLSMLKTFAGWFENSDHVNVGVVTQGQLWELEIGIGAIIVLFAVLIAAARTAWTHDGTPAAEALVGLVRCVLTTAMIGVGVTMLVGLADALTSAIIDVGWGGATSFTKNLSDLGNSLGAFSGAGEAAMLIVGGGIGIVVMFLLFVEMIVRAAGILVVTGTAPLGAAGLVLPETQKWWRRLVTAELALIMCKPIIALVYAFGLEAVNTALSSQNVPIIQIIAGFAILVCAAAAPFMVAKLFSFYDGQLVGLGASSMLGMRGASSGGSRSTGSQSFGQTQEEASQRVSASGGGGGGSGVAGAGEGGAGGGAGAGAGTEAGGEGAGGAVGAVPAVAAAETAKAVQKVGQLSKDVMAQANSHANGEPDAPSSSSSSGSGSSQGGSSQGGGSGSDGGSVSSGGDSQLAGEATSDAVRGPIGAPSGGGEGSGGGSAELPHLAGSGTPEPPVSAVPVEE